MKDMFLEIRKAEYLGDYRLRLWFNNGEVRDTDLADSLNGEVFAPLRDKGYFRDFRIPFNTVEWENGADFAPEYLYEHSVYLYDEDDDMAAPAAAEESIVYRSAT